VLAGRLAPEPQGKGADAWLEYARRTHRQARADLTKRVAVVVAVA